MTMNIKYERKFLIKALELACKMKITGRIRQELKYVQITAQEGECAKLEATDLETGLTIFCGSKSDGNGTCLIEPKSTLKWLRQIKGQDVTLTYEGTKAVLVANGISMACDTLPATDYPEIASANVKDNELAKIGAKEFRQAISQTTPAMAREQGRYCIECLYLCKERGRFTMVATDGKRMAVTKTNADFIGKDSDNGVLVPSTTANLLLHVLSRYENVTFHVRADGENVTFESACVIVTAKIAEGIFPQYKLVIPKKAGKWEFRVRVDSLLERLKMVAPIAAGKVDTFADINLGNEIIISAKGDGDGCEVKTLPLTTKTLVRGEEMIAPVNPQYMIDFLQTLSCGEVQVHMHDKMLCIDSGTSVYLLMYFGGESRKTEKAEPAVEKAPEIKETPKMDKPQKYTLIHCNAAAITSRHNITGVINGDKIEFKIEGKRKVLIHQIGDSTIILPGWDTLFVDSDGDKFHGNACLNISARTGMAMQGIGGLGKKEPILHSPEALRHIIDTSNLNPKLDKGLILYWTPEGLDKDEPVVLYPEIAAERHHAVLDGYLNKENDECKDQIESSSTDSTPPTPPAPTPKPAPEPEAEKPKTVVVAATSSTVSSQAHIETHVHLKKGHTYYIVVPHERVSREEWADTTVKAREVGGYYGNKFKDVPGGYCFKDKSVAEKFMTDHFAGVSNMVEQPTAEPKREPMGPLATCHVNRSPNVMHLSSGAELYGPGVIESDDHGDRVIARLMASGIDWNLPLEKLQENPAIESIVTVALSEKEWHIPYKVEPDVEPEPEPVAEVAPESNIVKVDFSTPDADLELQEALALAERL